LLNNSLDKREDCSYIEPAMGVLLVGDRSLYRSLTEQGANSLHIRAERLK
jgi:hypothetical protein